MEPVSLGVGVVALFSQCVGLFELVKTASAFETKFEILLVKLDLEQERFLVWGELVGLSDSGSENLRYINGREDVVRRSLESIQKILADTDDLRNKYGINENSLVERLPEHVNLTISALKRFRLRFRKFNHGPSVLKKTRWAISDASKFGDLVKDLRELIDCLMNLVPTNQQIQKIEDDIANLVDDIETLEALSEACKDDYPSFRRAADSAISASEQGTQADRLSVRADTFPPGGDRNEVVQNVNPQPPSQSRNQKESAKTVSTKSTSLYKESQSARTIRIRLKKYPEIFFILTDRCLRNDTNIPCDHASLGEQLAPGTGFDFVSFDSKTISSQPDTIVRARIDYKAHVNYTSAQLNDLNLQLRRLQVSRATSAEESEEISTQLAFLKIYIYCAPCACQISLALRMNFRHQEDWWVSIQKIIRVDHQLNASCCAADSERINACSSLLDYMATSTHDENVKDIDYNFLDISMYEYWDDEMEPIKPSEYMRRILNEHQADESIVAVVLLGERNTTMPLLKSAPFPNTDPRMPSSISPMFMLSFEWSQNTQYQDESSSWRRRYIGSYATTRPKPTTT